MKLTLSTLAALLTASTASAFTFPAHQQNGYRDTSCQIAPAYTDGQTYHSDASCPNGQGGMDATHPIFAEPAPVEEPPVDEPELPTCFVATGC